MRRRIFQSVVLSLLLIVIVIWAVLGLGLFRPLQQDLFNTRIDIVATIASEIDRSDRPHERAVEFEEKLKVTIRLREEAPRWNTKNRSAKKVIAREGYLIYTSKNPKAPMFTELNRTDEPLVLSVRFPKDQRAEKEYHVFFIVLIALILGVGRVLSRWVFQPLEKASAAMKQISEGNFSHRVTEDIGPAKDAFNTMADKVQSLILGQRQLVSSLSHELRTPLTRLRLRTEILQDEISPEKLNALNQDIDELDELVEMMLLSAKMEQGKFALRLGTISLLDLVLEGLSKIDIGDRYLRLEVADDLEIFADRTLALRIVLNLLSNIARYTPKDCTVSISARKRPSHIEFIVADTGKGVSDEFLLKIFEPFSREETSRSKMTGGWGLGLGFVKNVVELHQGTIVVDHNYPSGFVVQICFPNEERLINSDPHRA